MSLEALSTYIKEELLKSNQELEANTSLIKSGLIDSITTLKLVDFIENTYNVEFEAQEVDTENLDSIERILSFINGKLEPNHSEK